MRLKGKISFNALRDVASTRMVLRQAAAGGDGGDQSGGDQGNN